MDDLAVMTEIAAEHLWICEQMIDAQKRHTARLKTIGADVQNDMRPLLRHEAMRERPPAIGFFTTVQVTMAAAAASVYRGPTGRTAR
jgi:hypothetical protein